MKILTKVKPYRLQKGDGSLELNLNEPQAKAWMSTRRFIALLCGTQVGKTVFGPDWLRREIDNTYNAEDEYNDYIVATPTFPLLNKKLLPEMLTVFGDMLKLGKYHKFDKIFEFHDSNIRIFFASAVNPQSIESATAKAAWLDEAGQDDFKLETWDAILRRLSRYRGRILITTTLYNFGWLKTQIYDRWLKGDTEIDVIQAESIANPAFPRDEFYERKKTMPSWKFDLFYRGVYTKPAGMIYDCFDSATMCIPRFAIPENWSRYVGMDFAQGTPTAALFFALEPTTGNLYCYREYVKTGASVVEHAQNLKELSVNEPIRKRVGGAPSEDGWRQSFSMAGWNVTKPVIRDVDVGIDKAYNLIKSGKVFFFNDLERTLWEIQNYSRVMEGNDQITDKIQDKQKYHCMDAMRVILSEFNPVTDSSGDKIKVWRYYG